MTIRDLCDVIDTNILITVYDAMDATNLVEQIPAIDIPYQLAAYEINQLDVEYDRGECMFTIFV